PIYLNTTVGANPISTPTITTTYTVAVQDAIGCKSLGQDTVKVKVSQPLRVLTIPFDTIAYPGQQIQLIANSVGVVYNWSPASGLNNPFIQNPVATASNIIGGETLYKVVSTTADGCKGEGFVTIRISKGPDIYMPTAFTPNGDGLNEYFTPIPVGIKSYNYFKIFNRWGQLIFSTTRQNEGWDGRILGKEQPTGTYVWMIEGVAFDNRKITKKGIVTLIR
ncbi:MAG TPA: gliding motility-associated C-terminal domain-containing protein, partial [Chitinophagaceae bacterium]|nr:gliding motility-associated C-terminal domain-containing protein [Chitinophagaceae bacterium]